jgi:hypothetical protein
LNVAPAMGPFFFLCAADPIPRKSSFDSAQGCGWGSLSFLSS